MAEEGGKSSRRGEESWATEGKRVTKVCRFYFGSSLFAVCIRKEEGKKSVSIAIYISLLKELVFSS